MLPHFFRHHLFRFLLAIHGSLA
jgi:single-strand DNA-binding protein